VARVRTPVELLVTHLAFRGPVRIKGFCFVFEKGSNHVTQAGLELVILLPLHTGITGLLHHAQLLKSFKSEQVMNCPDLPFCIACSMAPPVSVRRPRSAACGATVLVTGMAPI
jgi:hypothetical protein